MSKLSDRLAQAKRELDISIRGMSEAATKAGYTLSTHSASVYTNGKHPDAPDQRTLEALAHVLRVPLGEVLELAGHERHDEPFTPHKSADLLTDRQRKAVNEIIRLLADGNRTQEDPNETEPQEPRREDYGLAAHTRKPGDPEPGQAPDY
ncbi:MAG: hypothetical protein ACTHYO_10470 [Micrococcaceae bacterium]